VDRLRMLKKRPVKPFAVMMKNIDVARRECLLTPEKEAVLTGHQKPIILLERKEQSTLPCTIAPGNPTVGVMLPYTPLHMLLFDHDDGIKTPDMLVMTSGNVSGAPICRSDEDAKEQISAFCDCILSHNREIRTRADDSVMDFFEDKPYMIRRSRGYSPLPFLLSGERHGKVLAVGGELKNTFCIGIDDLFYPSSYIGDLADRRSGAVLKETVERFEGFLGMKPEVVACDLHPAYRSTEIAESFALPLVKIQHHYAHVLSCMAENDCMKPVIGVSFDGTGYGTDGTIWGGEILLADLHGFRRLGHIAPFSHTGGDVASREGWRIAASILSDVEGGADRAFDTAKALSLSDDIHLKAQMKATERRLNTVTSTSAGRLFDAVSASLGICRVSTFEGEASCALEYKAREWQKNNLEKADKTAAEKASFGLKTDKNGFVLETTALFSDVVKRRLSGEDVGFLSFYFHSELSKLIVSAVLKAESETGIKTAALSGGVFQNKLLLESTVRLLRKHKIKPLLHSLIPPNDGGIALGQAVYAMENIDKYK
ncbi:MAG: Sua5/YciO/YrdC/YwlC family protein, partial [Clostridiales bacterium]|nr:Sua5/YciO/YrdC/YwlC family protein [Clostridiales bacterium]